MAYDRQINGPGVGIVRGRNLSRRRGSIYPHLGVLLLPVRGLIPRLINELNIESPDIKEIEL